MTRYYEFTAKAISAGYDVDYFSRDADEIRRHHYCDGFSLHVYSYAVDDEGYIWTGINCGAPHIRGIGVSSNDEANITWFVERWVALGLLAPALPVSR